MKKLKMISIVLESEVADERRMAHNGDWLQE